ncbi:hypothetical protein N0Y54_13260 [Nostoc punctiforme UO1]|uniref:hypothetical protein n=1 Tax=Nostoc punctiforme TaxID=272131 RepID=UPI00309D0EF3
MDSYSSSQLNIDIPIELPRSQFQSLANKLKLLLPPKLVQTRDYSVRSPHYQKRTRVLILAQNDPLYLRMH